MELQLQPLVVFQHFILRLPWSTKIVQWTLEAPWFSQAKVSTQRESQQISTVSCTAHCLAAYSKCRAVTYMSSGGKVGDLIRAVSRMGCCR